MIQYQVFSGHKWYHNHGILGTTAPDGMMYDVFDGPLGRNNDRQFMAARDLNRIIHDACALLWPATPHIYCTYADRGLGTDTNVIAAHHGPAAVSAQEFRGNIIMSSVRVCRLLN